jgi:hypothetical protein
VRRLPKTLAGELYLFDVAVYREAKDRFYARVRARVEQRLYAAIDAFGLDRAALGSTVSSITEHVHGEMHSPWNFNQIVGWIQVYTMHTQIRGELWWTTERKVRTRPVKRRFRAEGKAFEHWVFGDETDEQISSDVLAHLQGCLKGPPYRRGIHVDTEGFENLASAIAWRKLLGFDRAPTS